MVTIHTKEASAGRTPPACHMASAAHCSVLYRCQMLSQLIGQSASVMLVSRRCLVMLLGVTDDVS